MEHQNLILVLQDGMEYRQNDEYFYELICQNFTNLFPIEKAADLTPGDISYLLFKIYVFKIKKESTKKSKDDLPMLPRQVNENNQKIQFKQNGKALVKIHNNKAISKRTLTAIDKPYSLWEYVIDSEDNTWTVLHHYALKKTEKRRRESDQAQEENTADDILFVPAANLSFDHELQYQSNLPDINMNDWQYVPEQDASIINSESVPTGIEGLMEEAYLHETDASNNNISPPIQPIDSQQDDMLLINIPAYMYYMLLNESIAQRRFFNTPIHVHEDLIKFKTKIATEEGQDTLQLSLRNLTDNSFEFITDLQFIHLESPAGTGKTMAMLQLAKSFERDSQELVTVMCKAEYFWRENSINSMSMIDCLVHSSMLTADIREQLKQREWQENLTRVIQQGTGVILLLDAVDEMRSEEREAFLHFLNGILLDIPGPVQDVNIVALVVSSRPGMKLPLANDAISWTKLKMEKIKDSNHALKTLCADNDAAFEQAKVLQQNFKFPQTLFWYSLLAIEARTIDPHKPLANSQFDFLGGLLLQSIKITQQKKESLDDDQRELLSEDPTLLLHVAALIAYLAKTLGTTRIIDIEPYLSSLIITSSFPWSFYQVNGAIIKKLLPYYQFCHYSCTDDSRDKFIKFDHQIIWDYLAADFIVTTVVKRSYPSLLLQLEQHEVLKFNWHRCVDSMAVQYSEWTQTLHLVADALPVTQFTTMIKGCDEQQALSWISAVLNHPRCRDVTDPSGNFIKLFISCLFNASKKSVFNASETHQQKKIKDDATQESEDPLTSVGFNLVFKLFAQPVLGQLFFDDICQCKPLSLLLNELKQRGRDQEFVDILIKKFDSTENRLPDELVSLVKQMRDSDIHYIMEKLFYRLSSKDELVTHPMRVAIHDIFVDIFKAERCFDFLIEKLSHAEDVGVQASAMTVLGRFKTLNIDQINRLIAMIQLREEQQRVFNALPQKLPLDVFDDLLRLILQCESTLWSDMMQAFQKMYEDTQECFDRFFTLFYHFKTYLIAKKALENSTRTLSTIQIAQLTSIYQDPTATYHCQLDEYEIKSVRNCIRATVSKRTQSLTEEQKRFFDLLPKLPPRRFRIQQVDYEADTIENYIESFCSRPIDQTQITLLQRYYMPYYATTAEPALQLLEHVAEQYRTVVCPTIPAVIPPNDPIYRQYFDRSEPHLVAAQVIMDYLKGYSLDNTHLSRIISWMNLTVNMRKGVRDEWYSLLDLPSCHSLFIELSEGDIKWSVDNMVALWKVVGSIPYQDIARRSKLVLLDDIPVILHNWTQEDIDAFQAVVADLEFGSKLQLDVEKCIANLNR